MHLVIVRSREYLIAFTQRQSMVNNGQPGSRVLGQRDVLRVAADVIANGTANLERNVLVSRFENCAVNGNKWIRIDFCPVLLDRPGALALGGRLGRTGRGECNQEPAQIPGAPIPNLRSR